MNFDYMERFLQPPKPEPGDYTGEDGLLYCGKCHTPRQAPGTGPYEGRLWQTMCRCREEAYQAEEARKQEQERRRTIAKLRERCLPLKPMHAHCFDAADDAKHIRLARRYVDNWATFSQGGTGLLFWGNTGTGKSYAAHCIANALIDHGIPVKLCATAALLEGLMDRDKREDLMQRVRKDPLLILDDLGAERDTPYAREQLCLAIDERAECRKPLIVTTNYTLEEMKGCRDKALQRIFDRLLAMCVPVAVTGESRRRDIGAKKLREAQALLAAQ